MKTIYNVKAGTFFGLTYRTEKKSTDGSHLEKITSTVCRTGIAYANTKGYVAPKKTRIKNAEDVIVRKNSIRRVASSGNELVTIYPNWKQTHNTYFKDGVEVSKSEFEMSLDDKKRSGEPPKCISVNTTNIIAVKQR